MRDSLKVFKQHYKSVEERLERITRVREPRMSSDTVCVYTEVNRCVLSRGSRNNTGNQLAEERRRHRRAGYECGLPAVNAL